MTPFCRKRAWICRALTIAVGLTLFTLGVDVGDRWGLVMMIVGLVPAVTGIADVSLVAEIREDRAHRHARRAAGFSVPMGEIPRSTMPARSGKVLPAK